MNSLRKWLYRPKKDDTSLMAQFYYADEELNMVAGELDSFDGRKDPERCTALVNQLRQAQDKVLNICIEMMDELLPDERAHRDFRVKFPDDIMQETLSGQLWFGAECLAAGSSILNRESESIRMRPLARAVTKTVENVRNLLREQCLKPIPEYTEKIRESLKIFDRLFSEFEFCYVSAMVPVKTVDEYEMQQNVVVLFSETLQRAVKLQLISQDQIDYSDPALMFTVPRLAIVAGLVIFPDSPLKLEKDPKALSELFRPFKNLLQKIRELLWTMSPQELATLEKCLCSMEEPDISIQSIEKEPVLSNSPYHGPVAYTSDFVHRFCSSFPSCRQLTPDFICLYSSGKKSDRSERKRDRPSSKSSRTRARQERQSERFLSRLTGLEERPKSKRSKRPTNSHSQRSYTGHSHSRDYSPSSHYYPPRSVESTHQSSRHSSTRRPSRMKHGSSSDRGDARSRSSARPRRSRVSRQHSDRINTIICVCGSSRGQTDQSGERVGSQSGVEHHCPCTNRRIRREQVDHNVDSHPYSSLYFSQYNAQSCQHSEGLGSNVESEQLNREATIRPNIQSCVTNAVSDPEVLSSISMFNNQAIPMIGPGSDVPYPDPVDVNLSDDFQNIVYLSGNEHTSSKKYSCDNQRNVNSSYLQEPITHSELPSPTSMSSATKESQSESQGSSTQNSTQAFADTRLNQTTPEPYCSAMSSPVHQRDVPKVQETLEVPSRNVHSPDGYEDVSSGSTSPHQSGPEDDEEIALAMQAAEVAVSWKARERFTDSTDLIQRLFVCISGVADQLQTNCASDMRRILRSVFVMNQTPDEDPEETKDDKLKFTDDKESSSEDARSSNGSEELSVESAEDAMAVIGTPEVSGSFHSPPHELASDSEEEEPTSTSFDAIPGTSESRMLHRGSIVVPASVFNDHSLMQYSALSPPPITMGPHSQELLIDGEMDIGGASAYPGTIYMPESSEVYSSPRNEQNILFKFDSQQEIGGSCLLDSNIDGQQDLPIVSAVPAAASPHPTDSPVSNVHSSSNMGSPDLSEGRQRRYSIVQEPPPWLPDESAPRCMACGALFTMVRRRHHCRNCGKVFCGHCSRHSVPLPHFGIWKSVRVCNACFLYYVTSTADGSAALS